MSSQYYYFNSMNCIHIDCFVTSTYYDKIDNPPIQLKLTHYKFIKYDLIFVSGFKLDNHIHDNYGNVRHLFRSRKLYRNWSLFIY